MKPFPIISQERLIDEKYCRIDKHKVALPNGKEGDWFIKVSNDAVVVLPLLDSGEVLLQKTYKHGAGQVIIECCAGMVDDDEEPEAAAHRELLEETGYMAGNLEFLDSVYANPTGANMQYHFYVARGCTKVTEPQLDDAEQIENIIVPSLEEAKEMLTDGQLMTSAATRALLSYI